MQLRKIGAFPSVIPGERMSYVLRKGNIYGREEEKNVLGQLFCVVLGMSEKSPVRCMAKKTFSLLYRDNHVEQFSLLLLKAVRPACHK